MRYDDHNRMALFRPSSDLSGSSNYTATVSTDVSNLNGVSPASAHDFTFKTAVGSDTTKPLVTSFNPTSAATGVATKTSVSVVFDEYMDPFTVNSSTLGLSGKSVSVAYEALSKTAVIKPTTTLSTLTDYTASVSALVKDLCGNAKGSASYSTFTTAASAYNLPTRLSNILPNNGTDNRTVATVVSAAFSTAMDPSSFTQDTFTLENAMGKVSGTVSYDTTNKVAVFTPTSYLDYATIYTATLTSGVQSLSSSSLGYPVVWTFTTGNANGTDANSTTSAQVASSKGSGNIQVSLSTSNARLYGVSAVSDTATGINTSGKPTDYTFTDGLLAYQISVPVTNPGSSATVTLTFPNVVNGTQVYKVDSSGFSQFSGATVSSGNTVTMTVTDGGTGDTDGVINGVINDPVGLASISTGGGGGGGSSSGGGGGGCSLSPGAGFGLEAFLAVFTPLGLLAFRRPRNRRCRRM